MNTRSLISFAIALVLAGPPLAAPALAAANTDTVGHYAAVSVSSGPASAPTGIQAASSIFIGGSAVVDWTAPTDDGGSPVVYYAVYGFSYNGAPSMTVTGSGTQLVVYHLTSSDSYAFTVTAWNQIGWSQWGGWSGWIQAP